MKIKSEDFQVKEGEEVKLSKWPTRVKPAYKSKHKYKKLLAEQVDELSALQRLRYASNRHAVLLIFQAMDAAGKDGAIRHVMSGINPQGCQVFSFQHPSAQELDHDFLWRTTQSLPERHELQDCTRVRGARRRQGKCAADHFQDFSRYLQLAQDELPTDRCEAPAGTALDPQTVDEGGACWPLKTGAALAAISPAWPRPVPHIC